MKIRSIILFAVMTAGFAFGSKFDSKNSQAEDLMQGWQDDAEEALEVEQKEFVEKMKEIARQVELRENMSKQDTLDRANELIRLLNSIRSPEDLSQKNVDLTNAVNELVEQLNNAGQPGLANELREAFKEWMLQGYAGMFAPR